MILALWRQNKTTCSDDLIDSQCHHRSKVTPRDMMPTRILLWTLHSSKATSEDAIDSRQHDEVPPVVMMPNFMLIWTLWTSGQHTATSSKDAMDSHHRDAVLPLAMKLH